MDADQDRAAPAALDLASGRGEGQVAENHNDLPPPPLPPPKPVQKPKKLPAGNAVQIVSLIKTGGQSRAARVLKVDNQVLRDIVSKIGNSPVAVIAIAGPGRKGKSFMLSYIVRYLQALERSWDGDAGDWMDKSKPTIPMDKKGFTFQAGMDRTTDGIWMWTRPFFIRRAGGEETPLAVLLMDTEGCFDPFTNEQEQSSIVGLSLLLSSCFIYNDTGLINESTLITLAKFMQYGQIASQAFEGKVFQRLMFLIRDWNTAGFEHGAAGGQGFIRKYLAESPRMSQEANRIRKAITDNFEDYNAYLMPFPGSQVISEEFTGSVGEMKPAFQEHVHKFISHLIEDVSPKKFADELATGPAFLKLFLQFATSFNDEEMPSPASILEATIYSALDSRIARVAKEFEADFKLKLEAKPEPFYSQETLERLYKKCGRTAFKRYQGMRPLGTKENRQVFDQKFLQALDNFIHQFVEENNEKKREFLSGSAQQATQKVIDALELELQKNETKIWIESEFELLIAAKEAEALQGLSLTLNEYPEFLEENVKEFKSKITEVKERFWKKCEERKTEAETKILKIVNAILSDYSTWMEVIVSEEEVLSQKKLESSHNKQCSNCLDTFREKALKEIQDQDFIKSHQALLKDKIVLEFKGIEATNQKKLDEKIAGVRLVIQDVVAVFKEEILEAQLESIHSPELVEKYKEVSQVGLQALEDQGIPDSQLQAALSRELEETLAEALEEVKDLISKHRQQKLQQCENSLKQAATSLERQLQEFLQTQELFVNDLLDQHVTGLIQEIQPKFEEQLEKINFGESSSFKDRFSKQFSDRKKQLLQSNRDKVQRFESQANKQLLILTQFYTDTMKKQELNWTSLEQLSMSHQKQSIDLMGRLQSESPLNRYPEQVSKYSKLLDDQIRDIYETTFRIQLQSKCEQSQRINQDLIPSKVTGFSAQFQTHIQDHPFQPETDLVPFMETESHKLLNEIQSQVNKHFSMNSRLAREALDKFRSDISRVQKELLEAAVKIRNEAQAKIQRIFTDCLDYSNNHQAFTSMSVVSSSTFREEIKADAKRYFESKWDILNSAEQKENTWERLLSEITTKFNSAFEKLLARSKEENDIIRIVCDSILANICPDVSPSSSKFYPHDLLLSNLEEARHSALSEFENKLEEKGIQVTEEKLAIIEEKLSSKRESVLEENLHCTQNVISTVRGMMAKLYEDGRDTVLVQMDLDKLRKEVEEKALSFLQEKCNADLDGHLPLLETFQDVAQEVYEEFLGTLEAATASPKVMEELCKKAVNIYNESMKKQLENRSPVNPENLVQFHAFCLSATLKKIASTHFIKKELEARIQDRLQYSYKIFEDQNNLLHAERNNIAIGIDLGTTTSAVAIFQNGEAIIIPDRSGNRLTPSYVYFNENGSTIVGHGAKEQARVTPESTVFHAKRLIGREFQDPYIQEDIKHWPFTVKGTNSDETGKPKIVVRGREYAPEAISAEILSHMRRIARDYLKKDVTKAVITVPANFSDRQRDATRQAALIAGLDVLQIINEPTAAAMAYALNWKDEEKTVLVFDFGGGTFDVTILRTEVRSPPQPEDDDDEEGLASPPAEAQDFEQGSGGAKLKVLNTAGDTHLGGEDFDSRMVDFCAEEFFKAHNIQLLEASSSSLADIQTKNRRLRRLRNACEEAKSNLTITTKAKVRLDDIANATDLDVPITRDQFERMNEELFQRAIGIVKRAIQDARIDRKDITEVLMVGGSSLIPRVRVLLEQYLGIPSISISQKIHIQEAVALGAAVQACILNGGSTVGNLPVIRDIQPFSLGIITVTGKMTVIIPRSSTIPYEFQKSYRTAHDNQKRVRIEIYAGENFLAHCNVPLGTFTLSGIPPGPAGAQTINVSMKIDISGILNVTATAISTGHSQNLTIEECRGRYTDEEIVEMKERLQLFRTLD